MKKALLILICITLNTYAEDIYATFVVQAQKRANLAFITTGIVKNVFVEVGSVIKKDETIVTLHSEDLQAMLKRTKVSLKYAKKAYDRQLKVKHLLDKSKLDIYASKYESAKVQLAYQQALLDKTILKAPFDAMVYEKSVEVGDAVSGAMLRTILKIQSIHKRKLIISFDQKYFQTVKVGQIFTYKLDNDKKSYQGTIAKIYPFVNENNRKIKAEVLAEDIPVGLFGDGYILINKEK